MHDGSVRVAALAIGRDPRLLQASAPSRGALTMLAPQVAAQRPGAHAAAHRAHSHANVRCLAAPQHAASPECVASTRSTSWPRNSVAQVAEACCSQAPPVGLGAGEPSTSNLTGLTGVLPWAAAGALAFLAIKKVYDTPSRTYDSNVGDEYDAWTQEGILEYYWGEHIHLGYYTDEELQKGWWTADFKAAKLRFTEEMYKFSRAQQPATILDVGCGFGGSSRWMAATNPQAKVTGITLSPRQVERGTQLARERRLDNVEFKVMDALNMDFPDNSFDLVWACESGEHMPDKARYVQEMTRVLKPGGHLVIACWCQREETPAAPLTQQDKANLQFLYDEWAHPYFISIQEFCRLMQGTGQYAEVGSEDWTRPTLASWRHSNLVGVLDPWMVVFKWNPKLWYKVTREIVTLERMHRAFDRGLMQYGLMRGTKAPVPAAGAPPQQQQAAPQTQQVQAAAAAAAAAST